VGILVADTIQVTLREPRPRYLVGSGKAREIADHAAEMEAEIIIVDDDLSPSQQRNWEKLSGAYVMDRHELILDIFAERATTRVASLQVELARLEYALPRLTRAWTHLSRQRGGTRGTRGEGETQLEVDRRRVLHRIDRVKRELRDVERQRGVMRHRRRQVPVPTASLVGYTNAGKSSLLNMLTGAGVLVANKLFATLDATTRQVALPGGQEVLVTDTVGFIRKLPHDLVDAFKSTLEETVLADFLIHVIDASSPEAEEHYTTTKAVLEEIGAGNKPTVTVLNKIDKCTDPLRLDILSRVHPDAVPVSCRTGEGIPRLIAAIGEQLARAQETVHLAIPTSRYDLVALVHRTGTVLAESHDNGNVELEARVSDKTKRQLQAFLR
jgi:GTP-binding protein HflX